MKIQSVMKKLVRISWRTDGGCGFDLQMILRTGGGVTLLLIVITVRYDRRFAGLL